MELRPWGTSVGGAASSLWEMLAQSQTIHLSAPSRFPQPDRKTDAMRHVRRQHHCDISYHPCFLSINISAVASQCLLRGLESDRKVLIGSIIVTLAFSCAKLTIVCLGKRIKVWWISEY